jgi:hypothetical protein
MKCLIPTFLLSVAILLTTQTYNDAVSGSQTASADSVTVAFNLNATGELPGMLHLTVRHEGGNITGGTWKLTVLPANADATANETGTLTGSFSGGTLTLDTNGIATGASSVQLTVQSGTGQFETVTSGTGTLSLSADPENSTKLGGPLALSF